MALPDVRAEADILALALAAAARAGDPQPALVQHTTGPRNVVTATTGSSVWGDEPSYLVAVRGSFTAPRPAGPPALRERGGDREEDEAFSVLVLVVNIETGKVTDMGGGNEYPDLASVGAVVTDRGAP